MVMLMEQPTQITVKLVLAAPPVLNRALKTAQVYMVVSLLKIV
jgi:hypothetical protein